MKSFRGTFIFTLIVISACVFSYFEVFKKGNEETEKKEKDSLLYKLTTDEVSQIELTNGEILMSLKKENGSWSIQKPVVDKADQAAVKSFLDMIGGQKTSDLVEEGEKIELKTYGLDHPAFRLKLSGTKKDPKGDTQLVEDVSYGSVKAYDGSNYSRFGEEKKVWLAPAYLSAALNKKPSDFRNKNLITTGISDIDHIVVEAQQKVELERGPEKWKFLVPKAGGAPASAESIQNFLDLVRNIKGTEIASDSTDQSSKFHLDKPAATLRLHRSQDPKDYELKISDPKKDKDHNIYMISSDATSILKGTQSNLDTLNKVAFDFTDKHQPFAFGAADVGSIQIKTSDFKADLKKVGNAWLNNDKADKREVDKLKVEDFLTKFNHLEAKRIVKEKVSNLKNQIFISDSSQKVLFKMNWSEPVEDKTGAKAGKSVSVLTNKIEMPVIVVWNEIDNLSLKSLFKNPDPIQFSGSPPPANPAGKKSSGASLDQRPQEK